MIRCLGQACSCPTLTQRLHHHQQYSAPCSLALCPRECRNRRVHKFDAKSLQQTPKNNSIPHPAITSSLNRLQAPKNTKIPTTKATMDNFRCKNKQGDL